MPTPTLTLTAAANAAAAYLGILDAGETLSAAQVADALIDAKNLIDNWNSEGLMIPQLFRSPGLLTTAGNPDYSVAGTGGIQWNFGTTDPPVIIVSAAYIFQNTTQPMQILSVQEWSALPDRSARSNFPKYLWYERIGGGSIQSNAHISPAPLAAGQVDAYFVVPMQNFPDATAPLSFPFGYPRPFIQALAVEMAPRFHMLPSEGVMKNYEDALARIRNLNAQMFGSEPAAGQVSANTVPPGAVAASFK